MEEKEIESGNLMGSVKEGSIIEKSGFQYSVEMINGELSIMTKHYGLAKIKDCKHYTIIRL